MGLFYDRFNSLSIVSKQRFLSGLEARIVEDHYALREEYVFDFLGLYRAYMSSFGPRIMLILLESSRNGASFSLESLEKILDIFLDKNIRDSVKVTLKELLSLQLRRTTEANLSELAKYLLEEKKLTIKHD